MLRVLAFIVTVIFIAVSCRKEGCTSESALNFSSDAKKDDGSCVFKQPNSDVLCNGSSSVQFIPLVEGNKWTYSRNLNGNSSSFSEEVVGIKLISSIEYTEVKTIDYGTGSIDTVFYRYDTTGDLFKLMSTSVVEFLLLPSYPQVGDNAMINYTVSSVNATFATADCNYSGCIELTENNSSQIRKRYFKKGLGYIGGYSTSETEGLTAVTL